jgi:hypothetical protein
MPEWFQKPSVSQAQRSARTRAFHARCHSGVSVNDSRRITKIPAS